jgi:hypothetical protein
MFALPYRPLSTRRDRARQSERRSAHAVGLPVRTDRRRRPQRAGNYTAVAVLSFGTASRQRRPRRLLFPVRPGVPSAWAI